MTHDIVTRINRETSLTAMAHLTCAAHTRAELTEIVTRYDDAGIRNILALRGDPPKDLNLPPGDLAHATDLIELVRDVGDFSVGVAVHPEGHPASTDRATDRRRQAEKLARADFGISQFFFEADVWFEFLGDLRELGVTTRVIPGIMPVLNVKSVKRMAEMSGADFPALAREPAARGRGRRRRDARGRYRSDDRAVPRAHGRRRRLLPLLHAESLVGDARDLRQPRLRLAAQSAHGLESAAGSRYSRARHRAREHRAAGDAAIARVRGWVAWSGTGTENVRRRESSCRARGW